MFNQSPNSHLRGRGCPICKLSKGELNIKKFLENNKIEYIPQYRFKDCRDKNTLPFDFYLPNHNVCIEYDGKQHFEPYWCDVDGVSFNLTKKHDGIKNNFCSENNIKLIRIKYDDINILNILSSITTIEQINDIFFLTISK